MSVQTILISILILLSNSLFAAPNPYKIRDNIAKLLPDATVENIVPSPIPGLYQITANHMVFYATEDGHYVFHGHLLDLSGIKPLSLTEVALKDIRKKIIDQIDPKTMIIYSPPKPKHTVTVFTDIDCGYCRRFHQEVPTLNTADIAVRYVSFPRAGTASASFKKAVDVWCSNDPQTALTQAKSNQKYETNTQCDKQDAIIKKHMEIVSTLMITGTPSIFLEDGTQIPGYLPANELIEQVNQL